MDVIALEGKALANAVYLVLEREEEKGNSKNRIGWLLRSIDS